MWLDPRSQTFNKFKLVLINPESYYFYLHYLAEIYLDVRKPYQGGQA
jgi:hypothetical protein